MKRCHVCGATSELSRCANCAEVVCSDCVRPRFYCRPCEAIQGRSDLGGVAEAMLQAIRRFRACLTVETNTIAILETAPDLADAHGLLLEIEALLPDRIHALRNPVPAP